MRLAHPQRGRERPIRRRERRHHGVADRLDDGAGLGGDDLVQHPEMAAHEIVGDKVADPLVELGRALEIGEQEGQAGDLEALIDVERVGAVDVAEGLVAEQALRRQERPALAEQVDAARRRRPRSPGSTRRIGAVLESRAAAGPGASARFPSAA